MSILLVTIPSVSIAFKKINCIFTGILLHSIENPYLCA